MANSDSPSPKILISIKNFKSSLVGALSGPPGGSEMKNNGRFGIGVPKNIDIDT